MASAALLLVGCGKDPLNLGTAGSLTGPGQSVELVRRTPGGVTRFMARNVQYRFDPQMTMTLLDMNADVVLRDPNLPYVPANKTDYSILIHHAKVEKSMASLERLMNGYVFAGADTPLKDLKMKAVGDRLAMTGKMKQGPLWTPFEMEGVLEPTPEGRIKMTPKSIKALGLRVDGLMGLIGLEMSKLLKTKESKGVTVVGNSIFMDITKMYPPPTLIGRVVGVGIQNGMFVCEISDGQAQPWPKLTLPNVKATLAMWGGDVLINSTLNINAKIQMVDATPDDPMVFALDLYREQLEAGFIVGGRDGSLTAYVPDVLNMGAPMGRYTPTFPIPGLPKLQADAGYVQGMGGGGAEAAPN